MHMQIIKCNRICYNVILYNNIYIYARKDMYLVMYHLSVHVAVCHIFHIAGTSLL